MQTLMIVAASVLAIATALPIARSHHWWVRGLDFPRLQIMLLLAAWLIIALVSMGAGHAVSVFWWIVVGVSFLYQIWWIFPYTRFHKVEAQKVSTDHAWQEFSLLTSNVLMTNRNAEPLLNLVRQHRPDVLATLETDTWWESQLDSLSEYPHRLCCALDNKYGMHIYSQLPFKTKKIDFLVEEDIPSMGVELILADAQTIKLHIVHPRPPAPGENHRSTERDVELLLLAQHLQDANAPLVVSGDLNDVAWSRTTRLFRRLSGLLDIRIGRGLYNTFHADYQFIRWPLDHIFVSTHFRVEDVKRLTHIGSDHFPVMARLALGKPDQQEAHLELREVDEEHIEETLNTEVAEQATAPSMK